MTGTDLLAIAGPAVLVLLVPLILVASLFAFVRFDRRISQKRETAFRAVAGELGLEFQLQGINGYWGDLSPFDLFQHGRTRWFRNVLHGATRGVELCAFDYQHTTGSDRHPQCRHQTAVGLRAPGLDLTDFRLRLKSWGDPAGPLAPAPTREIQEGYRDIVIDSRADFSKHYQLSGIDEAAVRRSFTEELSDYFAAHPALNVEAHADRVLVYGKTVPATPEAIRELIEAAFAILARLRSTDSAEV